MLDRFAKPENVSQIGKNQNDKFLLINAWQESMKRLLTFTLSQSRDGKWRFYTSSPLYLLSLDRKLIFSKTKGKKGEVKTKSVKGKHTHCIFCVREFVIIAGELIISFI